MHKRLWVTCSQVVARTKYTIHANKWDTAPGAAIKLDSSDVRAVL